MGVYPGHYGTSGNPGHNWDMGPNSGSILDVPGWLATMSEAMNLNCNVSVYMYVMGSVNDLTWAESAKSL